MAGATLTVAAAALLLATELPQGLALAADGGGALAELAARSPGARIGGVALKAKAPRSAMAPITDTAPAPGSSPGLAAALGTNALPEGPVPTSGPGVASDVFAPPVPGIPGLPGPAAPGASGGPGFAGVPFPSTGGLPIFLPGGPGGGGGSPGTGTTPPIGETPGGGTVVPTPGPTPGAGPIPEPSTWLMLIAGFAAIGSAMRRSRRVRFA